MSAFGFDPFGFVRAAERAAQVLYDATHTGGALFPFLELTVEHPITHETLTLKSEDLEFDAVIQGEYGMTPQTGVVSVFNVAPSTKNFFRRLMYAKIRLGYRDGMANTVLNGLLTNVENPRRGADDILELHMLDATWSLLAKKVKVTFINADVTDIVRTLLTAAGVPILSIERTGVIVPAFVSGQKAVMLTIRELMDQYLKPATSGLWKFYVRQGSAVFTRTERGFSTGVVLKSETGLKRAEPVGNEFSDDAFFNKDVVTIAEKLFATKQTGEDEAAVKSAAVSASNQVDIFGNKDILGEALRMRDYSFDSILQPLIVADSIVYLDSYRTRGYYRTKSYRHVFNKTTFGTSGQLTPVSRISLDGAFA